MKNLFLCIFALAILGCETTGDPRQGGLFGWSEEKAVERQNALKQTQYEEERKMEESRAESERLNNEKAALQAEVDRQKAMIGTLDADLNKIRKQIKSAESKKKTKDAEVRKAKKEAERLQTEINRIRSSPNVQDSIREKQQKIDALNKDIDKLMKITEAL